MSENQGNRFYSYTCPNCGADMEVVPQEKAVVCQFCGKKLYFAEDQNANNQNANPQNTNTSNVYSSFASQVQEQQAQINRNVQKAKKIVLIVYAVIVFFIVGCVATSIIAGFSNAKRRTSSRSTTAAPTETDPFNRMKVVLEGKAPYGKIQKIYSESGGRFVYQADKSENLSNGDVITITVDEKSGYKFTSDSYTYTVSGLDTLVMAPSQILEPDVQAIQDFCIAEVERSWGNEISDSTDDYQLTVTPYALYVSVKNEETYYGTRNYIVAAYQIDFVIDGHAGTAYTFVKIPEPQYTSDGTFKVAYDEAGLNGYMYMREYGYTDSYLMTVEGFDSTQKLLSAMEQDGYTLVK